VKEIFVKYIRDEIEQIVKEHKINRGRFFEVSKQSYKLIIEKIELTFVDKSKSWNEDIHWVNMGKYNPNLKCVSSTMSDWSIWLVELLDIIPSDSLMYILFEDTKNFEPKYWLYESYIKELILILNEINGLDDFYIVSKKYNWLISLNHHDAISYVGNGLNLNYTL
jgi:hypothetical protein